jgi:hypothetical protein
VSGTKSANQIGTGAQVQLGGGLQTGTEAQVLLSAAHSRRSKGDKQFSLLMLRPMAVKAVPLGDAVIVLAFAVAAAMVAIDVLPGDKKIALAFAAIVVAALMFVGGGDGVCDIVALLG